MKLNVVLVEPEIPQNTGNIARTCAALGAKLHLVYPLGFSISEKQVKRAGLDYWDKLEIEEHLNFEKFLEKYKPEENNMFFVTTKGKQVYSDFDYSNCFLNIQGRTCIGYAFAWGLLAIFLIRFINPYMDKIINNLKNKK